MLAYAVVKPDDITPARLADDAWLLNCEGLFLGATQKENVILIGDRQGALRAELISAIQALPTHSGQRLQIYLENILAGPRLRYVDYEGANTASAAVEDQVAAAALSRPCDAVWVGESATANRMPAQVRPLVQEVGSYLHSQFEAQRREFKHSQKSIHEMAPGEFEGLLSRCVAHSSWLRFYDRHIGINAGNPRMVKTVRQFAHGIAHVVAIWRRCAAKSLPSSVEVITVAPKPDFAYSGTAAENQAALEVIERALSAEVQLRGLSVSVELKFGTDVFHARYLESQLTAVKFDRGFDFVRGDGTLKKDTNFVRLDDNSRYLAAVRALKAFVKRPLAPAQAPSRPAQRAK